MAGSVLVGRQGEWDARGARLTAVLPDGSATYDGRASKEENFSERTGLAEPHEGGALRPVGDGPVSDARYLDVVETPDGYRTFYEYPLPDGSHELRTESIVQDRSARSTPEASSVVRRLGWRDDVPGEEQIVADWDDRAVLEADPLGDALDAE